MNILHALHQLLGQHQQARPQPHQTEDSAPVVFNGRTMPLSSVPAGGRWTAPPSHGLQVRQQYVAPLANYSDGLGGFAVGAPNGPLPQGGQYNPGYTPLQNSGFGPGGNPQIGAFNGPQNLGHINPQLRDTGYFWNQ